MGRDNLFWMHVTALILLGGLASYTLLQGVFSAIVLTGQAEVVGLPTRVTAFLSQVPRWRFLIGYSLIILHVLAWVLLIRRSRLAIGVFAASVLFRVTLTTMSALRPDSAVATSYVFLIVEAVIALILYQLLRTGFLYRHTNSQ